MTGHHTDMDIRTRLADARATEHYLAELLEHAVITGVTPRQIGLLHRRLRETRRTISTLIQTPGQKPGMRTAA